MKSINSRANLEMYEELRKKYQEKRDHKNEKKIVTHFLEEDSQSRVNPWQLKGSNPYLLLSVFYIKSTINFFQ